MSYFYQLLIVLISGSFAAWLTTRLALRRFYNEKWWEKRANAFIEITDAVYQIKLAQEYNVELKVYGRLGPHEYPNFIVLNELQINEILGASKKANDIVKKFSQVGPLLVTERVSKLLSDYIKENYLADYDVHYKGWDYEEAEEHMLELTSKLLVDLVAASKRELKLH